MWKHIPHLMQRHKTPRKEYKISNVKHYFKTIHTSCCDKSLIILKKEDENED